MSEPLTAAFTPDADWLAYHPAPSRPVFRLPEGAVDAHCHVFGPGEEFPYAPERNYTPCDAGKDALFALRDHLGVARNVIVQATCHGADNRALVDALLAAGDRARGVATVRDDVTDTELADLHAAGSSSPARTGTTTGSSSGSRRWAGTWSSTSRPPTSRRAGTF
jgi:2-pyrone-4,6-dicarboxylate lactonase